MADRGAGKDKGEEVYVAPSGAKRTEKAPFFHLIPLHGLTRVATRYTLGSLKYDEADDKPNWRKGLRDPAFLNQAKDHMALHMLKYFRDGNVTDDNLAAVVWGCLTLMEAEHENGNNGPHPAGSERRDRPRGKNARTVAGTRPAKVSRPATRGGRGTAKGVKRRDKDRSKRG